MMKDLKIVFAVVAAVVLAVGCAKNSGIDTSEHENELVLGSADEVLEAGFVIDEDSPEDIMDVFGGMDDDANTYED